MTLTLVKAALPNRYLDAIDPALDTGFMVDDH